jgi:hypothetical protein
VGETDALLSVWAPEAGRALPIIEELDTGRQVAGDLIDLDAALGGLGAGIIAGLTAGRDYRWHLRFDTGRSSPWFALRTAPPILEPVPLTVLYSADIDLAPAYDSPIFDTMAASGADCFVSLGDFPYADNAGGWTVDDSAKLRDVRAGARCSGCCAPWAPTPSTTTGGNNWDGPSGVGADRSPPRCRCGTSGSAARRVAAALRTLVRWGAGRDVLPTPAVSPDDRATNDAGKTMGATQKQG